LCHPVAHVPALSAYGFTLRKRHASFFRRSPDETTRHWRNGKNQRKKSGFTPIKIRTNLGFLRRHQQPANTSNDLQFSGLMQRNMYLLIQSPSACVNTSFKTTWYPPAQAHQHTSL
jgi:hypothetical protein